MITVGCDLWPPKRRKRGRGGILWGILVCLQSFLNERRMERADRQMLALGMMGGKGRVRGGRSDTGFSRSAGLLQSAGIARGGRHLQVRVPFRTEAPGQAMGAGMASQQVEGQQNEYRKNLSEGLSLHTSPR
jgi:hypothetical protein